MPTHPRAATIRFSVGGFYGHSRPRVTLLLHCEAHPEWFREGVRADATFDLAGRDVALRGLLADFARLLVREEHPAPLSFAFLELLHAGRAFRSASGAAAAA